LANLDAGTALATGLGTDSGFAVQALGQYAGDGCLAHAPRAGKQIGVVQTVVVQRVDQRLEDVLLPDHFAENAGAPLAGEYLIAHFMVMSLLCYNSMEAGL